MSSSVVMALVGSFVLLNVVCVVTTMSERTSEVSPKNPDPQACLREGKQCGLYFHRGEVISPTCCKPLVCGYQDWEYYCLRQVEVICSELDSRPLISGSTSISYSELQISLLGSQLASATLQHMKDQFTGGVPERCAVRQTWGALKPHPTSFGL
ncbi:hypothetical protein Bbelb_145720 [Branchiostoma belcheri]|nr:hypothetical protein Bbelb_145720 [Branchiostoma belcheri]